jgi:hypothetical protein
MQTTLPEAEGVRVVSSTIEEFPADYAHRFAELLIAISLQ